MQSEDSYDATSAQAHASPAPSRPERARPAAPLPRLAATVGNRSFARTVARMRQGEGILPDGVVHPDVQSAIAAARGGGSAADRSVTTQLGAALGDPLTDVRIHADATAAALARSVSARAFTVGSDIFFAPGEYQPRTPAGRELLAHELTHVVQQRGAPEGGPLKVSQPGEALERQADAVAREV